MSHFRIAEFFIYQNLPCPDSERPNSQKQTSCLFTNQFLSCWMECDFLGDTHSSKEGKFYQTRFPACF